jgi:hypothetical protein
MVLDGTLLRDLLIQSPVIALLLVFIFLERRDHAKAIETLREENVKLQTALIDHMNRLAE